MEQYNKNERDSKLSSALIMSSINIKLIVEIVLGSLILDQRTFYDFRETLVRNLQLQLIYNVQSITAAIYASITKYNF